MNMDLSENILRSISQEEQKAMRRANIDVGLSLQMLQILRENQLISSKGQSTDCKDFEIPVTDGQSIIDFSSGINYKVSRQRIEELLSQYPELAASSMARRARDIEHSKVELNEAELSEVGLLLSPRFAFGVLNGGSASSYFDRKKNRGFSPELFQILQDEFEFLSNKFASQPKALCPAFLNNDGGHDPSTGPSFGPSFIGLKLRALFSTLQKQEKLRQNLGLASVPNDQTKFFQMTSQLTHAPLQDYITNGGWQRDPAALKELASKLKWRPDEQIFSKQQPLIATFDRDKNSRPQSWNFFRDKNGAYVPMPGGHGQCFFALKKLLHELYRQGTRYISLGNIDNVAYNPQPSFIGLLALSGRNGLFICSYRTAVDIKGGVLLRPRQTRHSRLNCFDIGVGVDKDILEVAENKGEDLLFNCAIGYFDLEALLQKIDHIIASLPLRISEQSKDRGHYWQVEQVTWEVIGLLNSVLIGAVRKEDHFLAAKLQLEAFVNTSYQLQRYADNPALQDLTNLARSFSSGYTKVLRRDCGFPI